MARRTSSLLQGEPSASSRTPGAVPVAARDA
jgi:hypothetical protein